MVITTIDHAPAAISLVRLSALALTMLLAMSGCGKPNAVQSNAPPPPQLTYNTVVDFGSEGNSASLKVSGWSKTEEKFTWTEGQTSVLTVSVAPVEGLVTLRMSAAGMIKEPELPTHPVEVYVNDQKIADWQVGNTAPFSAPIPHELTKAGGKLTFTFKMPKAVSPKELGKNEDPRVLGMCVFTFELSTK